MYGQPGFSHNTGIKKSILLILLPALMLSACPFKDLSPEPKNAAVQAPLYIIKSSGPEPFYFELGPGGPFLIPSPAEASLSPFIPWTHSIHISHFLPIRINEPDNEEILYAAVNRGGILELRNKERETMLYYHQGEETWDNYQVAAFFRHNNKPTVFLASERFFSVEEHPSPLSPLWALEDGSLKAITISAVNADKSAALISNSVFLGKDEIWYIQKSLSGQVSYFRTIDLSLGGQEIFAEQYMEASHPLESDSDLIPPLLSWALAEAGRLAQKPCITTVVSPDFPAKRLFSSFPAVSGTNPENPAGLAKVNAADERPSGSPPDIENSEFPLEISGYYRQYAPGKEALAAILFPDGRGVYCRSDGTLIKDSHFSLPSLQSTVNPGTNNGNLSEYSGNFVYTGVALLGNGSRIFLVASWEEQKDWNVGAAGFLLLEINW